MFRTTLIAITAAVLTPMTAMADPVIDAVQAHCIDPLYHATPLGAGLEAAPAAMAAKLLNGKTAQLFKTADPQILVVAHNSGATCEVMALGHDFASFAQATDQWKIGEVAFTASEGSQVFMEKPGGGYYVIARDAGGYVQMFVISQPEMGFLGITAARVDDSAQAREILQIK